ncbi:hypothetical protein EC991_008635 [Linnemannia zychae]|nr:hypothetical protein EC991_008635 [Linnemannia zychae]
MRFTFISSAITLVASTHLFLQGVSAQQLCNGYQELCAKTYDQVAYATTHNAFAYTPPGALAANQNNNITTQLKDGIRAFMLDAYNVPSGATNDIELCHSGCGLLDAGPLSKVISIFWENAANLAPARFQTVYQAAGLSDYLYTQQAGAPWETLSSMIASKKRLLNYIDSGADASVPWLMAEYDFIFETPYAITKGQEYPCTIDRPKDQERGMYVMNHFISGPVTVGGQTFDLPQSGAAAQTNGPDLAAHANKCTSTFNKIPNFIAVDYYEQGSLLSTVAQLNGVKWNGKAATPAGGSQNGAVGAFAGKGVSVAIAMAAAVLGFVAL